MADLVLSAFLGVLFEKLASAAVRNIATQKGVDAEIKKWQRSLNQIQLVLADASHKEINSQYVKEWLNDLQHLAYDIEDVLDDLATDAMDREFNRDFTSKVRRLIPTCCTNFSHRYRMHGDLDDITSRLQDLLDKKVDLGLIVKEETRSKNVNRRLQTSVVDPSSIVGRQAEKEALVQQLLLPVDEACNQNYSIVPIVGMGGVGKTTLATLLYNEQKVKDHFELKVWVCVSDDFDSCGISRTIFKAAGGEVNQKLDDFNELQQALRDQLKGKRFLLVLDDIWSESHEDWKTLVRPFYTCAPGSKVIITTRKKQLLQKLGYNPLNKQLGSLSHDDALSLFAQHALGVNNFNSHMSLKPYGEGIVKQCGGLPLALIALGTSLRTKEDEDSWKKVLESEIWKLPVEGEIIPALKLSYHDLSARLKRLFAYSSLFPKDFLFNKEELILLWKAEGFLHHPPQSNSTEENAGHEYFDELLSRSFFQHAPNNESLFVMHDLMNDLATSVATEFFIRLHNESANNCTKEMLEKYRHMSFLRERYVTYKKFESFKGAKSLRTFLATSVGEAESWRHFYLSNKILADLLPDLLMLRVLCLSQFQMSEVPDSIGTLRHLRYLNLSQTAIKHLPETVSDLYNLETLILTGCLNLAKLPNSFLKLKNLQHLDISGTTSLHLDQMPLGIRELKNIQTLSKIVIGGENKFEIGKLKEFKNLCGNTSIFGLDKVENATHAREANFSNKKFIELELAWSDELHGSRNEMLDKEVLDELKPHNDKLTKLKINSYRGLEFLNWIGSPSFIHLKHVSISDCKRCTTLPPLGQLPSLKELFIKGLNGVEVVVFDQLGTGPAFQSLEILSFENMSGWKKWSMKTGVMFPCLQQLIISDSCNLVEVALNPLNSLNVLKLSGCDSGVLRKLVETASSVTQLEISSISGLNDVVWRDVMEYLRTVEELHIENCDDIRYLWESETTVSKVLMNLKRLEVEECSNLVSLGEKEEEDNCRNNLLTSLRMLKIFGCDNMKSCRCPYSIKTLAVYFCNSITTISLPTGGQKLKSVCINGCNKLLEREWGGQKTPMLEDVHISDWQNLKSISELNSLVHLSDLEIRNCTSLESFPISELPNLVSLKSLEITNCPSMDACFPCGVWPPNIQVLRIGKLKKPISNWGTQNFPTSLVKLELYNGGEDGVSSCSQLSNLLPSSLTFLRIQGFKKLESVSEGLQHLTSLQHLHFELCPNLNKLSLSQHLTSLQYLSFLFCPNLNELSAPQHLTSLRRLSFSECPNMMVLLEMLLPSLLSLGIRSNCRKLKERYSKRGRYWHLISHIPDIDISTDYR